MGITPDKAPLRDNVVSVRMNDREYLWLMSKRKGEESLSACIRRLALRGQPKEARNG